MVIGKWTAYCALIGLLAMVGVRASAEDEAPSQAVVEQVLKISWDREATDFTPKATLSLNGVRFGKPYTATLRDVQIDRIPEGAVVTPAIVDFTVRSYYRDQTQATRRVREARIYRDGMGDWAVMTGSVKGQDTITSEPPAP